MGRERPHVKVSVDVRNGHHPHVKAQYLTSTNETKHQICLKSNKSNTPDIEAILNQLYNRSDVKLRNLQDPFMVTYQAFKAYGRQP